MTFKNLVHSIPLFPALSGGAGRGGWGGVYIAGCILYNIGVPRGDTFCTEGWLHGRTPTRTQGTTMYREHRRGVGGKDTARINTQDDVCLIFTLCEVL